MAQRVETYDLIAQDLASWLESTSTQLAIAFSPQGVAPFAAPISESQKLNYYSQQLFNADGTPNQQGRDAELQRLGPIGFRTVYRAVIQAYPWLKSPAPPEGAAPSPLGGPTTIPAMASGGIVTQPTVALIGEAGPEAVVPLSGAASGTQPYQPSPQESLARIGQGASDPSAVAPSSQDIQQYIDQAARARGIDPATAMSVAYNEGGLQDPAKRGTFSTGSSWWPFQLHYGGQGYDQYGNVAGLGNEFTQQTGFHPGDPAAWRPSIDFALDTALQRGWYPTWYGSKPAGVSAWQGIPTGK